MLDAGFPLVALLQLVRVYAQSMRKIAEAEVRLFHLYVHEPLIRRASPRSRWPRRWRAWRSELMPTRPRR